MRWDLHSLLRRACRHRHRGTFAGGGGEGSSCESQGRGRRVRTAADVCGRDPRPGWVVFCRSGGKGGGIRSRSGQARQGLFFFPWAPDVDGGIDYCNLVVCPSVRPSDRQDYLRYWVPGEGLPNRLTRPRTTIRAISQRASNRDCCCRSSCSVMPSRRAEDICEQLGSIEQYYRTSTRTYRDMDLSMPSRKLGIHQTNIRQTTNAGPPPPVSRCRQGSRDQIRSSRSLHLRETD